jgi:hypothetical protein
MMDMQEFVVPRSIPRILGISDFPFRGGEDRHRFDSIPQAACHSGHVPHKAFKTNGVEFASPA